MNLPDQFIRPNAVLWTFLLTAFLFFDGYAQTFNKTIEESYDGKPKVAFSQARGPLQVRTSNDGKVRFVTQIQVEANSQEIANQFFNKFQPQVSETATQLDIELTLKGVKRWNQNNNKITITFKDGSRLRGLSDYKIQTTLYVPATQELALKSRFEDITIEENVTINDLKADLFSADLEAGDLGGSLSLEVKFGKANFGKLGGDARVRMHNSKLKMGNAKEVNLDTRFSDIQMGDILALTSKSHNDRVEGGHIAGDLKVEGQFSSYIFQTVKNAEIKCHNVNFEFESGQNFRVNGKFSDFEIERLESLEAMDSHNDEFEIGTIKDLKAKAQFSTYRIQELSGSIRYTGHSGKFAVRAIQPGFEDIEIDGRFFEVDLTMPSSAPYHVAANLTFGDFQGPENLKFIRQIEKNSQLNYTLKTDNATESSPKVNFEGQNLRVRLR